MKKSFKINTRHDALKALIEQHPVENQLELVKLLKQEYNIEANQAIISRDLHELGITKKLQNGKLVYQNSSIDVSQEILNLGITDIVYNEAMIIVKTLPGLADYVGDYLDGQENSGILATLAGENVVFITPWSVQNIEHAFQQVCSILGHKPVSSMKKEL
ncbi:hypothetical protein HOM50_04250 [bacterium]|jgi:transcriptional regulator of arginine metabolism|nr:hypothetical protein [bacterium]MBT5015590.1 hypothetical protein [bacterium]